ncbi:MAG: DUF4342 domain-containing protein [Anaerolineaceae bacterium]|nr:DUF4342 domain-containing protein [Anaerolineaceae bacterium]MCY3935805.1 DUF4342 domain-containing protein [Chloroflexota bacterium]MCY4010432.1 DUF4342 domain-containing protein [Anaerolineaceae bacterium]MCY4106918.1 DUF4342 domain-containing protein [Chloroflexota bacterium]
MNANDRYEHLTVGAADAVEPEEEFAEDQRNGVDVPIDRLFEFLQKVLEEGAARRLILRDRQARVLLDVPLGPSALVGTVGFLLIPMWLRIVTIVGVLSSITVEIQREVVDEDEAGEAQSGPPLPRKQRITIERDEENVAGDDEMV